jgi:hypothetical protein
MTRLARFLIAALMMAAVPVTASAGSLDLLLGVRSFEEDVDLEPSETHDFLAIQYGIDSEKLPVHVFFALQTSEADNTFSNFSGEFNRKISTTQFDLGMIKLFEQYTYLRPYVGGGFSIVKMEDEVTTVATGNSTSEDDTSPGLFLNGGVYVRLGERLKVGIDLRILRLAAVDLGTLSTDANSIQLGMMVGWRFGSARSTGPVSTSEPPPDDFEDEFDDLLEFDDQPEPEPDDSSSD